MPASGPTDSRPAWFAWVFLVVASLAFGASAPLARSIGPASPFQAAFVRLTVAAVAMLLVCARRLMPALRSLPPPEARKVLAAGAILGFHFSAFLWGIGHTSLPAAVSLVSVEPVAVVLACAAVHGLRPTRSEGVGLILAKEPPEREALTLGIATLYLCRRGA